MIVYSLIVMQNTQLQTQGRGGHSFFLLKQQQINTIKFQELLYPSIISLMRGHGHMVRASLSAFYQQLPSCLFI